MEVKELENINHILRRGGIVIFPTETVYGIGVDPFNREAVKKLYNIKKRDRKKPLTLHIATSSDIYKFSYVDEGFRPVIERFLPGPLTVIFPKKRNIPRYVVAGKKKVGFRFPKCPVTLEILKYYGYPIAATSVNISGKPPINDINEIEALFEGKVDYIVKDVCELSKISSTVVDFTVKPFKLLREGEIGYKEIEKALKGGV